MLDSIRHSIIAHKVVDIINEEKTNSDDEFKYQFNYKHAFHLATFGGAEALGLQQKIGSLEVGKEFDAIIWTLDSSNLDLFDRETAEEKFEKYFYS